MKMASFVAALLWTIAGASPAMAQSSSSVWDGVYSAAQASGGQRVYGQSCAPCHGAGLNGTGESPPLLGGQFLDHFDGSSVGDLFDRIVRTMPKNLPGSLKLDDYAAVLAYVLQANGFPPGQSPLSARSSYLHAIAFEVENPHPGKDRTSYAATGAHGSRFSHAAAFILPVADVSPAAGAAAPAARSFDSAPPADTAALEAANKASGVLSPAASDPRNAPNSQPNPYRTVSDFLQLPPGRTMGSTSSVAVDSKGNVWVFDRCGANSCAGNELDPIMEFASSGRFIKAFGRGRFIFPHGIYVDAHDHIWVVDEQARDGKGADVLEFDQSGKVLRTLGKPGIKGEGPDAFSEPSAVLVTPSGVIFVADGHDAGPGHPARVVKFDRNGKFLTQWGGHGVEPGHFDAVHCLALDHEGRLYVGDRWNSRIQVFDQNGKLLRILPQFGRPSGCYVDRHDVLYVTDSESREPYGYGYHPGWKRGVRLGSIRDGIVTAFIPDDMSDPDKSATSGGEGIWVDPQGAIYCAEVGQKRVLKYLRE
jgi:sugar lactone lactonase YvrE/mono/diheme cytochrome c family protein